MKVLILFTAVDSVILIGIAFGVIFGLLSVGIIAVNYNNLKFLQRLRTSTIINQAAAAVPMPVQAVRYVTYRILFSVF